MESRRPARRSTCVVLPKILDSLFQIFQRSGADARAIRSRGNGAEGLR